MMCGYCQLTPCDHQGMRDDLEQCEQDLRACAEALRWAWKYGQEHLEPWKAWIELETNPQRQGFHCWGCDGEFISIWPQWIKPTDETFPHKPDCGYVQMRAVLDRQRNAPDVQEVRT